MQTKLKNITDSYNFTDNVPKDYLFVKLASGISDSRREFIANGVRAYFKDDFTVLVDRTILLSSINSAILLFQIFVTIVGIIALTLAFFLLLISTTSNIKENLWELGVLKAIGLNKDQSKRIYMYEAFAVIIGALILGIMVGLAVSFTLSA